MPELTGWPSIVTRVWRPAPRTTKFVLGDAENDRWTATPGIVPTVSVRLLFCRKVISSGGNCETADFETLNGARLAETLERPMTRRLERLLSCSEIATSNLEPAVTATSFCPV